MNYLAFLLDNGQGTFDMLPMTVIMIVMLVGMWWLTSSSQKKRDKEAQDMRDSLQVGDEVTTIGGVIGKIVAIKGETFVLETTKEKTHMRFLKAAIRSIDVKVSETTTDNSTPAPTENEAPKTLAEKFKTLSKGKKIIISIVCIAIVVGSIGAFALLGGNGSDNDGDGDATYSQGLEFKSYKNGTCYVSGIGTCTDTVVKIPQTSPGGDTVVEIFDGAFSGCTTITAVEIPETVTTIGDEAFMGCSALSSITIPKSVTVIEDKTFYGCSALAEVNFSASLTKIGFGAFAYCDALTNIVIPKTVDTIGASAFYGCGLKTAEIDCNVEYIDSLTFANCVSLETIVLGDNIIKIADDAFTGSAAIDEVCYTADEKEWKLITGNDIFDGKVTFNYDPDATEE